MSLRFGIRGRAALMKNVSLLLLVISLVSPACSSVRTPGSKVISGATVVDGTGGSPIEDAVIVIQGSRIKQVGPKETAVIPPDAEIIDVSGKFIIAGLGDAHNHIDMDGYGLEPGPPNYKMRLGRMLAWGFTTIFDPGTRDMDLFSELKRVGEESPRFSRYFGVGRGFAAEGGYGQQNAFRPDSPAQARAMVRQMKVAGVDAIKIYYSDLIYVNQTLLPVLEDELLWAIIDETHKNQLKAYAHAPVLKYAKKALRAGLDGLVHGILSEPVDQEFIDLMKKNEAIYISTFAAFDSIANLRAWVRKAELFDEGNTIPANVYAVGDDLNTQRKWEAQWDNLSYMKERLPILRTNLKKVWDEGITVVCGSDLAGAMMGVSSQMELVEMVAAGLTPQQAIRTATINVARMLGRDGDQGTVEAGKLADLVILNADPLLDIGNIRYIHRIVLGGSVLDPAELLTLK